VSAIFISHSSRDDEEARVIRGLLSEVLAGEPHHHKILLDEDGIKAGNLWRPKLYGWLAECGGAVLLLTKQALESPWVRKEATVLLWRQALGSRVIIIPLLIGVSRHDAEMAFPAIEIFDRQYLRISDSADTKTAIGKVAEQFSQAVDPEDLLGSWAKRLYSAISELDDYYQSELAQALHASEQTWPDTPDGRQLIVHALLHTTRMFDVQTAVEPVLRLFRHPPGFVRLVSPIGIPAEAAAGIMTACARAPGERVLVLTCTSPRTAVRYIRRASCVNEFYKAADPPGLVDAGSAEQLFDDIFNVIADQILGCDKKDPAGRRAFVERVMNDEDKRGRIIQVLRSKAGSDDDGLPRRVLHPLVARLRQDLPYLVILVLAWPPGQADPALGIPGAHVVDPAVQDAGLEDRENSYLRRLERAAGP
jgi:TIR domain